MRPINSAVVICGFPGVRKSSCVSAIQKASNEPIIAVERASLALSAPVSQVVLCDSDSSQYPKENFPQNYLSAIKQVATYHPRSIQLVSTHDSVLSGLDALKLDHYIVRPTIDQKAAYLKRYADRNSPQAFIDLMDRMWENFVKDVMNHCLASAYVREVVLTSPDLYLGSPSIVRSIFG